MKSSAREDLRRLAAEAILKNVKSLAAQIPDVRAQRGTEPVHDLRVASRRVRTALRLCDDAAPSKRYRRWNREVKRLASALSRARDTDVQAESLRKFLKAQRDARLKPGIQQLILRLRERRTKQQGKMCRELDRFAARGTLREMRREFKLLKEAPRRVIALPTPFARAILLQRLKKMLAYERYIARSGRRRELHRMRIAAKHFRYTLEAFAPDSGGRLGPCIRAARQIQTDLGEIHDCDVWIHEALPEFLSDERARGALAETGPGIAALMRDRRKQRNALYRAFLRHWRSLRRKKTFERMSAEY